MLRLLVAIYFLGIGFYSISNPEKMAKQGAKSKKTETNIQNVVLGGIGSLFIGLLLLLWVIIGGFGFL